MTAKKTARLMQGDEACAEGAIAAGCMFFAGYPITPATEIAEVLARRLPQVGGKFIQMEDEIGSMAAIIGASVGGAKSLTATSGPGLALMTEMLGLASQAEVPAVIFDVQRVGPSTGIPTKSEQSDLFQALWGTHGDAPRVVIAPADVEDCFHATVAAFNIAERFQIPVIVLSDQYIAQRQVSLPMFKTDHDVEERLVPGQDELRDYKRYRDTPSGVSPMSFPGIEGGEYQTTGLEHDEYGRPTSMHLLHEQMNERRYRKLMPVREHYSFFRRHGSEDAEVGKQWRTETIPQPAQTEKRDPHDHHSRQQERQIKHVNGIDGQAGVHSSRRRPTRQHRNADCRQLEEKKESTDD